MDKTYVIELAVTIPGASSAADAEMWAASLLDVALTKPNPTPRKPGELGYRAVVPLPVSEHPFHPRVVRAYEAKPEDSYETSPYMKMKLKALF